MAADPGCTRPAAHWRAPVLAPRPCKMGAAGVGRDWEAAAAAGTLQKGRTRRRPRRHAMTSSARHSQHSRRPHRAACTCLDRVGSHECGKAARRMTPPEALGHHTTAKTRREGGCAQTPRRTSYMKRYIYQPHTSIYQSCASAATYIYLSALRQRKGDGLISAAAICALAAAPAPSPQPPQPPPWRPAVPAAAISP